jgi:hypothetical protein
MKLDKTYKNVSVSSGTLDVDELVCNCSRFLQSLQLDAAAADRLFAAEKKIAVLIDLEDDTARTGKKNILFNYFFKILEDISPKGCFFGIHPGDPGKLGFWDKSIKFSPD